MIRKKVLLIIAGVCLIIVCSSCNSIKIGSNQKNIEPQISQMKAICELATLECYYHNVAKYKQEDVEGILWWKKDKHFWIEYSGVVKIGVDMSKVRMDMRDNKIKIDIPKAQVLSCRVDESTLNDESFIIAKDSAKITAEDQTNTFKEAQERMLESAKDDSALLASAQQRAQELLEDYIKNIGNAVNKQYQIEWIYTDSEDDNSTVDEKE